MRLDKNTVTAIICCDHFLSDSTGKPCYIGVFERIKLSTIPGALTRFFCAVRVTNLCANAVSLSVESPSGPRLPLGSIATPESAPGRAGDGASAQVAQVIWDVSLLPWLSPGDHTLIVEADGVEIGRSHIAVTASDGEPS